jgi:hypothetical protein
MAFCWVSPPGLLEDMNWLNCCRLMEAMIESGMKLNCSLPVIPTDVQPARIHKTRLTMMVNTAFATGLMVILLLTFPRDAGRRMGCAVLYGTYYKATATLSCNRFLCSMHSVGGASLMHDRPLPIGQAGAMVYMLR